MWIPKIDWTSDATLHRSLMEAIAADVATGKLAAGERLPTHRDLADRLGVARGTIARVYRDAEKLGLVKGAVGRGTFALGPGSAGRPYATLLEPPTGLDDLRTNAPLTGIDPDPADIFRRLAARPDRAELLRTRSPMGAARHRAAGVAWLSRLGVEAKLDDVFVTSGAQHAVYVVLAHVARHTRVVYVEELTYPGVLGAAEALSMRAIPVALDHMGLVPSDLERLARKHGRGAVFCTPTNQNPTGAVMSNRRRVELARVARARDLTIIEDAANRMLVSAPPRTIHAIAPERTYLIASVSKVLSPGLRTAYLVAPSTERAAIARGIWATQWMAGTLGPELVAMWLEDGTVDRTVARKRREAMRRQRLTRDVFGARSVDAHPESMHAWIRLPPDRDVARLVEEAAARGIVVTPSAAFWARPGRPPSAFRVALGGADRFVALARGLRTLRKMLETKPARAETTRD